MSNFAVMQNITVERRLSCNMRYQPSTDRSMQITPFDATRKKEVLRKSEDEKKTEATVMPKDATGEEGRANHVDVAKRSYLEALTRSRE